SVAMIVVEPWASPLARPAEPGELEICATAVDDELHCTELVRLTCEPSVRVPVATNCCDSPLGRLGFAGVTAIEASAGVTVSTVDPVTPASVALIVDVPAASALASPIDPAVFEIVAVDVFEDAQVAAFVRSWCEPSEKVPIATNCWLPPAARV